MRLKDQVCVVTGGGSGIGAAICRAFAREGGRVVVADVDMAGAAKVAAECTNGLTVLCDVSQSKEVDRAIGEVVAQCGRIDVLVNNAGILGAAEYKRSMEVRATQLAELKSTGSIKTTDQSVVHLTDEQWDRMVAIHLNGTFYCSRAALRVMREQRSGAIINMSSQNAFDGGNGNPHYATVKAGILGFTKAISKEAIREGIRVNAIAPGFVETPLRSSINPIIQAAQIASTPLGRPATAEEIADSAVFLASKESSYFVGETLSMTGGHLYR